MKKICYALCFGLVLVLSGCAGTQKGEPVSTDSLELAVAEAAGLKKAADAAQAELLSFDEYQKGSEYLAKAQKGLAGSYQADYILENSARSKTQLQAAIDNARDRTPNAVRILEARKSALDAGLKNSPGLEDALENVDDDVRDDTDNFEHALEPRDFSKYQKQYFSLEVEAVQFRELDSARTAIQKADRQDAEELAPRSLRTARLDLSEAENLIAQSPRDPGVYQYVLNMALESSVLLTDVMDVILDAPGTPEDVAVKIVEQNRKLAEQNKKLESLSEKAGSLEKSLQQTQTTLMQTEGSLQETESALLKRSQELEETTMQVRFQRAMDQAVQEFSDDEASVYQQGDKLIFRLKKINFASGSAVIPAASKPLLNKVNDIIASVGAELVAVQGHTDSIGDAKLNKNLSTKRAIAVANYLASLRGGYKIGYIGYGEDRPIASNETREGRAINRRVDLVVTARK
ncbi:MAG: OmpA family protein [Gammaproteobacteria bacterium]|jgi:outer membrane protein OmpA-like peptidoglycan-associated protein/outer membrane murein-binding lipoprotein Lpp